MGSWDVQIANRHLRLKFFNDPLAVRIRNKMFRLYYNFSRCAGRCEVRSSLASYSTRKDYRRDENESRHAAPRKTRAYRPNVGARHTLDLLEEGKADRVTKDLKSEDYDFDEKEFEDMVMKADQSLDEYIREQNYQHRKMKFKKLEREHFRQPQEKSLLTWAAKEQLKYLHETDPDTWTLELLHQSFPISIAGVKKLLKSDFRPQTEEDIIKHDRAVLRNWKQQKLLKQGPISTAVGHRFSTDKFDFEAMDGNQKLPMPTAKWKNEHSIAPVKTSLDKTIKLPIGEFGAILKDYVAATGKGKTPTVDDDRSNADDSNDLDVALMTTTMRKTERGSNKNSQVSIEEFKRTMRENIHKYKKSDPVVYEKFNQYMEDRQQSEKSRFERKAREHQVDDGILEFLDGNIRKFKSDSEETEGLRWDTPRAEKDTRYQEAYMYNPKTGYQRPYGRHDQTDKVEIPANRRVEGAVWKKGHCYYDEDGNLLYRVPLSESSDK